MTQRPHSAIAASFNQAKGYPTELPYDSPSRTLVLKDAAAAAACPASMVRCYLEDRVVPRDWVVPGDWAP